MPGRVPSGHPSRHQLGVRSRLLSRSLVLCNASKHVPCFTTCAMLQCSCTMLCTCALLIARLTAPCRRCNRAHACSTLRECVLRNAAAKHEIRFRWPSCMLCTDLPPLHSSAGQPARAWFSLPSAVSLLKACTRLARDPRPVMQNLGVSCRPADTPPGIIRAPGPQGGRAQPSWAAACTRARSRCLASPSGPRSIILWAAWAALRLACCQRQPARRSAPEQAQAEGWGWAWMRAKKVCTADAPSLGPGAG